MGYLTFAGTTIKRFDEGGRFLDQIGRAGEGPGEFGAPSLLMSQWCISVRIRRPMYRTSPTQILPSSVP